MSQHSILPPSSAYQWVECPGSITMQLMHPETEERESAKEGDAAHWLGARMVTSAARARVDWPTREIVGTAAPNGIIIDDEMYSAAEMYADDVLTTMRDRYNYAPVVEQSVAIPRVHELCYGTPDTWMWSANANIVDVWDFKYGHLPVEARGNWQGIAYTSGILDELGFNGHTEQQVKVRIRIVQPRAHHRNGPIREWIISATDLRPYVNKLHMSANLAIGADPPTKAGPWCRDCTARHACATAMQAGAAAMEYIGDAASTPLDGAALGHEIRMLRWADETVKMRLTGLEAEATARIRRGEQVSGWGLESGMTARKWTAPPADVIALGDALDIDLRKTADPVPITPTQAIKKGIDEAVIAAYSDRQTSSLKLVPMDHNAIAEKFKNGNE